MEPINNRDDNRTDSILNSDSQPLPNGTVLQDRYRIIGMLGKGGFGITYLGSDIKLEREVAIKEYFPAGIVSRREAKGYPNGYLMCNDARYAEIFAQGIRKALDEAKRVAKFTKVPGIVNVYDHFEDNGTAYIVMEYVQGETLENYLKTHRISVSDLFAMIHPIFIALEELHRTGIIHRDISPDNIMYSAENGIKLLDFGAARDYMDNSDRTIILKRGYAPLEQCVENGVQGPWTDVYALAATIYKLISGVVPQPSLDRAREDNLEDISKYTHKLSRTERIAIMRALGIDPTNRWKSVEEFETALYEGILPEVNEIRHKKDADAEPDNTPNKKNNKLKIILPIVVLINVAIVLLCLTISGVLDWSKLKKEKVEQPEEVTVQEETEVSPKPPVQVPESVEEEQKLVEVAETEETSNVTPAVEPDISLMDLETDDFQNAYKADTACDSLGNEYTNELVLISNSDAACYVSYKTKEKYNELIANFSCISETEADKDFLVEVYKDDKLDASYSTKINKKTSVISVDVDISGAKKITIKLSGTGYAGVIVSKARVFADFDEAAKYYAEISTEKQMANVALAYMTMTDAFATSVKENINNDLGFSYENAVLVGDTISGECYATYYLGGQYKRMLGNLSRFEGATGGDFDFEIKLDNDIDPVFSTKVTRFMPIKEFNVDVSGAEFVTVKTVGETNGGAILSDTRLYTDENRANVYQEELEKKNKLESVKLYDAAIIDSTNVSKETTVINSLGQEKAEALVVKTVGESGGYAKYYLGGQYNNFVANISSADGEHNEGVLQILDDNNNVLYRLFTYPTLKVCPVNVDVSGSEFLTISLESDNGSSAVISDARLYTDEDEAYAYFDKIKEHEQLRDSDLESMHIVESRNCISDGSFMDNNGEQHRKSIALSVKNDELGFATWYLDGQYTDFVIDISCLEDYAEDSGAMTVAFFEEDSEEPLYSLDIDGASETQTIDLDVTDIYFLTVKVFGGVNNGIILSDGKLYTSKNAAGRNLNE